MCLACREHTIPSSGPSNQGLQGYRVSSLRCPRYGAVTGAQKNGSDLNFPAGRNMQFGRPDVLDSALHARPRARGRAPARLPRPAFKSRRFLCCSRLTALPHRLSCSTSLAQTIFLKNQALERVADASSVSSARLNSLRTAPGRPRAARVRRARAFYINPASARARLIGWAGRRFKLAGDRFWAPVAKRAVSAKPAVRGCCA